MMVSFCPTVSYRNRIRHETKQADGSVFQNSPIAGNMSPQPSVATIIPAFTYRAVWCVVAAAINYFLGIETNQRSQQMIG
jgi:hypothetical protein